MRVKAGWRVCASGRQSTCVVDDELDDGGETTVGMANSLEFLGLFLGVPFSDDGNGVTGLVGIDFQ